MTASTTNRAPGLNIHPTASAVRNQINAIEREGHWTVRAAILMPDHLHLFVRVHAGLALGRCMARLKSLTRPALAAHDLQWQPNFYEHRLRPDEPVEPVVRYIFLNAYHANLLGVDNTYPWVWLGTEEQSWFDPVTDAQTPFPEWLR